MENSCAANLSIHQSVPVRRRNDMRNIARNIDRRSGTVDIWKYNLQPLGVVTWGKRNRFIGLILREDVFFLDFKYMVSSRIKVSNLCNIPYLIYYSAATAAPFSCDYLISYIRENEDNPYGLWNYLRALILEKT